MSPAPLRLAVLISGTGSNLKTLIDARDAGRLNLDIVLVISNRAAAPGLDHARRAGIPITVIGKEDVVEGDTQDAAVRRALEGVSPDLVLLAGYMRILGPDLVGAFEGRMINQHPSLLPKFKGLDTYRRVLEAGDAEHGASVHFVTAELDDGPVISQVRIPVERGDDTASLAARLGPIEHRLLVATMELFVARRVTADRTGARLDGAPLPRPLQLDDHGFTH